MLIAENSQRYIGALRNEGQKIFFRPSATRPDILLYDFGAEVGDTVWHNAAIVYTLDSHYPYYKYDYFTDMRPTDNFYSIIYAIDIINNRKVYYTNTNASSFLYQSLLSSHVWHEGIGNEGGLFSHLLIDIQVPLSISPHPDIYFTLHCFKHNDTVKYLNNPSCNKCFCPTIQQSILYNESDAELIKIFSNPTNGEFRVQSSKFRIQN